MSSRAPPQDRKAAGGLLATQEQKAARREPPINVKVVIVGDGAVGKTCLLITWTKGVFPKKYVPTVFDNYSANVWADNNTQLVNLGLWDTAGQEDYARLRPLSYPQTNCFMVTFSVVSPISFENVRTEWLPELREQAPRGVPWVLVGTKSDLKKDPATRTTLKKKGMKPVTVKEATELAKRYGAAGYVECSALTGKNLDPVFELVINAGMEHQRKKLAPRSKCFIL